MERKRELNYQRREAGRLELHEEGGSRGEGTSEGGGMGNRGEGKGGGAGRRDGFLKMGSRENSEKGRKEGRKEGGS